MESWMDRGERWKLAASGFGIIDVGVEPDPLDLDRIKSTNS
jgi:hypothetical protein